MTEDEKKETTEGIEAAERIAKEAETGVRSVTGYAQWMIPIIAVCWSLFQLALPSVIILNTVYVRAIHLGFAITLVYLSYPLFKRPHKGKLLGYLSARTRFTILDYAFAGVACFAALYIAIFWLELSERQGSPLPKDIIVGFTLTVLILEAARRSLGPTISVVAGIFILYAFFGPYMPSVLAFKGVSLSRFMSQMTISTEGIYGVPLDVSATIVFLFVLFGSMLDRAGGGKYFVDLAFSLLGRFKGGPAKAAVLASGLTGLVSGSSIANTVTTGTFTIPLMKSVGYPDYKAGAVEVAASTNGQLMPPIMGAAAFIIAEYCNISYIEVVKHAFVPAIISYIALMYITHLEASKLGLRGLPKEELPKFFPTLVRGIHFIIPLTFLVYELVILRHSPELSAFRAILVLAILILIQNPIMAYLRKEPIGKGFLLGLKQIGAALAAGGKNMMGIGVAVATAGIIVGVVTMGLGGIINEVVLVISGGNLIAILVLTAVACLLLGMGLPTTANYIVMATLTAPIIVTLGADAGLVVPLIAAHLFVFFFGILADDTPPVGLAAFAASAIAKSSPIKTGIQGFTYDIRTAILPFMFIFNTEILLIGVKSVWHAVWIFITCVAAMFAFANATQNWFIVRNRWYEGVLLIGVALIILRPDVAVNKLGLSPDLRVLVPLGGLILYGIIFLLQKPRARAAIAETTEATG
ncbi:MAG: TRAP transporter permease [Deltaproteobacteria bacterium]|nr:TRAP transporter permease [Deltaproteobacteria bacterium]